MKLHGYEKIVEELKEIQLPIDTKCSKAEEDGKVTHCSRATDSSEPKCSAYWNPTAKWRIGDCSLADLRLKAVYIAAEEKKRVGQQKQKRR